MDNSDIMTRVDNTRLPPAIKTEYFKWRNKNDLTQYDYPTRIRLEKFREEQNKNEARLKVETDKRIGKRQK